LLLVKYPASSLTPLQPANPPRGGNFATGGRMSRLVLVLWCRSWLELLVPRQPNQLVSTAARWFPFPSCFTLGFIYSMLHALYLAIYFKFWIWQCPALLQVSSGKAPFLVIFL
jgi:hypothetical protein